MIANRQSPAYALFYPPAKDGVLNESTPKDGQPIAHLSLLGGAGKTKF